METMIKYMRNSGNCQILAADPQVTSTLNAIATDGTTKECISAQGLLKLIFGGIYNEWIEPISNNNMRIVNPQNPIMNEISNSSLNIYPNPITDNANLLYNLPVNTLNASLEVFDITGRKLINQSIVISDTKTEIITSHLNNGVYFCVLIADGSVIEKTKFVVIK